MCYCRPDFEARGESPWYVFSYIEGLLQTNTEIDLLRIIEPKLNKRIWINPAFFFFPSGMYPVKGSNYVSKANSQKWKIKKLVHTKFSKNCDFDLTAKFQAWPE